uniref:Uncharacterized protein n=1 Tax=Caenorhabditis tropicalis TaxID=1561998 RepID=A0A1I7UH57_9PELO
MSSTPNLDQLFEISVLLNKASVYGCSSSLAQKLERATEIINKELDFIRSERSSRNDIAWLEWRATCSITLFRLVFGGLSIIDEFKKDMGEDLEKKKKEDEESIETRLQALRIEDKGEIRRLKRVRCKICRKNSKLTKENWELKAGKKADEFSKQFGSLKMNAELLAKCQEATTEQHMLKESNEFLRDYGKTMENKLKNYQAKRDRLKNELVTLRNKVKWDECESNRKDERIKKLEEDQQPIQRDPIAPAKRLLFQPHANKPNAWIIVNEGPTTNSEPSVQAYKEQPDYYN